MQTFLKLSLEFLRWKQIMDPVYVTPTRRHKTRLIQFPYTIPSFGWKQTSCFGEIVIWDIFYFSWSKLCSYNCDVFNKHNFLEPMVYWEGYPSPLYCL